MFFLLNNPTASAPTPVSYVDGNTNFIASQTFSGATYFEDITNITSDFRHYTVYFNDVSCDGTAPVLGVQVYQSGGRVAAGYRQQRTEVDSDRTFTQETNTSLRLTSAVSGDELATNLNGVLTINNPADGYVSLNFKGYYESESGGIVLVDQSCILSATGAATYGFRVASTDGNVAGTMDIYGMKDI